MAETDKKQYRYVSAGSRRGGCGGMGSEDGRGRGAVLSAASFLWILWCVLGCSPAESEPSREALTIVSWNVQALFDGHDDGHEYNEYREEAGWTDEKYRARLNAIAAAMDGLKPGIMALIELENPGVLQDLAELSGQDYRWSFFAGAPESSTGLGVLSRFPLEDTKAHSLCIDGSAVPRPVAEVRVNTGSGTVLLLVCHWKSKLGGEQQTETVRRSQAGIIARRLEEIAAAEPGTPVIVLGDLNENYDEFLRTGGAYLCALLPDTGEAAELAKPVPASPRPGFQDFLVLSEEKPPRPELFGGQALYSPWMELRDSSGSYYYQGEWETIDHFLLNAALFNGEGWEYEAFLLPEESPFRSAAGIPRAYNPRTGNGLSDHLPIILNLKYQGG
ncbi:MAG: endonuclease/exonuclease/phosphatase family protein [Treponema sp.]|nr:endonuclease/exonuclease/phosphatase family protein [Treponema sp.]